jgi:hypothetical protein
MRSGWPAASKSALVIEDVMAALPLLRCQTRRSEASFRQIMQRLVVMVPESDGK